MKVMSSIDAGMKYGLHSHSVTVTLGSNNSNICFQHTKDKAPLLTTRGGTFNTGVIVNWATFGEQNSSLCEYNADFDFTLDAESNNKGRKMLVN